MIEMNKELITAMRQFKEVFGDIVPLRELPQSINNEELIVAIYESIDKKVNNLSERFGYQQLEKDGNKLI